MAYILSSVCFLTAAIGWFISWCFGESGLAAFTIPCLLNGWDRSEKASAIMRSVYYYLALGLLLGVKDLVASCRSSKGGYTRLKSEASLAEYATHELYGHEGLYEAAVYAPLVSKRRVAGRSQGSLAAVAEGSTTDHEVIAQHAQYGGTDVEMRRIPLSQRR